MFLSVFMCHCTPLQRQCTVRECFRCWLSCRLTKSADWPQHPQQKYWIHFLLKQSLYSYLFQININIRNKVCFCDWRMFRIVTRLEKLLSRNPLLTNCITYGSLSGNFSGFHLKYTSPGTKPVSVNSYYTRTGLVSSSQPRTKKLFFYM